MAFRTDDPISDHMAHEARQQAWLDKLPVCYECDHPIQTEECFEFNGELICPECLNENHRKAVEDYVG